MDEIKTMLEELRKSVEEVIDSQEAAKQVVEKLEAVEKSVASFEEDISALKEAVSKTLDRVHAIEEYLAGRRSAAAEDQTVGGETKDTKKSTNQTLFSKIAEAVFAVKNGGNYLIEFGQ